MSYLKDSDVADCFNMEISGSEQTDDEDLDPDFKISTGIYTFHFFSTV